MAVSEQNQKRIAELEKKVERTLFPTLRNRLHDLRREADDLLTKIEKGEQEGLKHFYPQYTPFYENFPVQRAAQIAQILGQIESIKDELDYLKWEENY